MVCATDTRECKLSFKFETTLNQGCGWYTIKMKLCKHNPEWQNVRSVKQSWYVWVPIDEIHTLHLSWVDLHILEHDFIRMHLNGTRDNGVLESMDLGGRTPCAIITVHPHLHKVILQPFCVGSSSSGSGKYECYLYVQHTSFCK